jgi:hypothetical protein
MATSMGQLMNGMMFAWAEEALHPVSGVKFPRCPFLKKQHCKCLGGWMSISCPAHLYLRHFSSWESLQQQAH